MTIIYQYIIIIIIIINIIIVIIITIIIIVISSSSSSLRPWPPFGRKAQMVSWAGIFLRLLTPRFTLLVLGWD